MAKAKKTGKSKSQMQAEARKHLDNAKKKFTESERKVRSYIKSNPEKAALAAAGLGAALGAALTAALRKKRK